MDFLGRILIAIISEWAVLFILFPNEIAPPYPLSHHEICYDPKEHPEYTVLWKKVYKFNLFQKLLDYLVAKKKNPLPVLLSVMAITFIAPYFIAIYPFLGLYTILLIPVMLYFGAGVFLAWYVIFPSFMRTRIYYLKNQIPC